MSASIMVILVGAVFWLLTCLAVFDVARKDFGGIEKKALWGFVSLIPFLGPLVYFIFGFRQGRPKGEINL